MMRRLLLAGMSLVLVLLAFSTGPDAQAQTCTDYNGAVSECTSPTPTTGFAAAFADQGSPDADSVPATPTPAAVADDTDAPQLAFTGSETDVLAYVGSGLVAAGAVALAVHRRMTR